jgi:long-chain acyl-CoA synthetase
VATKEVVDDEGWLHTGDLARMVGDEIKIIDRKKDVMITAGGKNITPSEVENALKTSPYIKEAIVIADGRPFVSALVQIDYPYVSVWADEQGIAFTNYRNLAENERVRDLVQAEVDAANAKMPQVQQVRKFHILTKELDHDDGEVTATLKIKRKAISAKYEDLIENLYGSKKVAAEAV